VGEVADFVDGAAVEKIAEKTVAMQ